MYAAGTHAIGSSIRLEALLFVRSGKSLQKNWNSQLFIHRASLGSLVQKMPGGKEGVPFDRVDDGIARKLLGVRAWRTGAHSTEEKSYRAQNQ
jgi:hypothetical protein